MSKIADDVYVVLKELFPYSYIIKEHYIYFKGTKLFFDFYIKDLNILIEVQGEQHFKFSKHMHGTIENFRGQIRRDNLKIEFCSNNNLTLVFFYDKVDKINKELVLNRLYKAQGD